MRVLAGEGGSLRAVLAPAGYGKTTMLHTAARAAAADDRPVVAVATSPCPQHRRRDSSVDRIERSKHSNGYHPFRLPCPPDIPRSRHAAAHRPRR